MIQAHFYQTRWSGYKWKYERIMLGPQALTNFVFRNYHYGALKSWFEKELQSKCIAKFVL